LPKQKGLVCRGETLHIIILDGKPSVVIVEFQIGSEKSQNPSTAAEAAALRANGLSHALKFEEQLKAYGEGISQNFK